MTPEQCAALMTYANQIDARIQLNDPTLDAWWSSIGSLDFEAAKWGIKDYYANANPNDNRGLPSLLPASLRHRVNTERDRHIAKQRALEPPPKHTNPQSFRSRHPEEWDALVIKGRDERRAELAHRGIGLTQFQIDGDKPTAFQLPT